MEDVFMKVGEYQDANLSKKMDDAQNVTVNIIGTFSGLYKIVFFYLLRESYLERNSLTKFEDVANLSEMDMALYSNSPLLSFRSYYFIYFQRISRPSNGFLLGSV